MDGTSIIVFFPENGVSEVQKRQMVTQAGENTHVVGIHGNFDDAQTAIKEVLNDTEFKKLLDENNFMFSSANSINIGRLVPQVVYYVNTYRITSYNVCYTKLLRKIQAIGAEKAFIEFTSPPRDKGTRYLRNNENLWMYFPKANRTIKISGHMLRQSMMGSDISYEDQTDRNKLNELYDSSILSETDGIYTLELLAKEGIETSYYRRVIDIAKDTYTIKNSSMYANSGKLLKVLTVEEIQHIGDRYYITSFVVITSYSIHYTKLYEYEGNPGQGRKSTHEASRRDSP